MSKTFKRGLTGSGKKRVRRVKASGHTKEDWLTALDRLNDRFEKIATLAGLLYAQMDPNLLDTRLVASAGHTIEDELNRAKALIAKTWEKAPQES